MYCGTPTADHGPRRTLVFNLHLHFLQFQRSYKNRYRYGLDSYTQPPFLDWVLWLLHISLCSYSSVFCLILLIGSVTGGYALCCEEHW